MTCENCKCPDCKPKLSKQEIIDAARRLMDIADDAVTNYTSHLDDAQACIDDAFTAAKDAKRLFDAAGLPVPVDILSDLETIEAEYDAANQWDCDSYSGIEGETFDENATEED